MICQRDTCILKRRQTGHWKGLIKGNQQIIASEAALKEASSMIENR